MIIEEIVLALKHARYFDDSGIGMQFVEQLISQVLTPMLKGSDDDEDNLVAMQQPAKLQYIVGILRFLILLQTPSTPQ